MDNHKIYIICGPTATGKTDRSIELAQEINGEIISADSRQVYRGLDIGTAKIPQDEMQGIAHHMIDVCDVEVKFSAHDFQEQGRQKITEIIQRGNNPIIVGGTGYYIHALVYDTNIPTVPPNENLRMKLEKDDLSTLQKKLLSHDKDYAERIDIQNKRRVVRALEIIEALGVIPEKKEPVPHYKNIEWIYCDQSNETLKDRIHQRNYRRVHNGLIEEVQNLISGGISLERLDSLGLEYRYVSQYINGNIASKENLIEILDTKTWQFVKRQRTWFKKFLPEHVWFDVNNHKK